MKTSPVIAILDFDIKDVVKSSKRTCLFLKSLRPLSNINEVIINVIKFDSKIMKPDIYIYKKVIEDFIYRRHWKRAICIILKTLYLNNT